MDEHSATMEEVRDLLYREGSKISKTETIPLYDAVGRVIAKDYDAKLEYEEQQEEVPIIRIGEIVTPEHASVLAEQGLYEIEVYQKPRVLVVSMNNGCNGPMVAMRLNELGIMAVNRVGQTSTDEPASVLVDDICDAEAVILLGNPSKENQEGLKEIFVKTGAELLFQGVDIQPGSSMMAAKIEDKMLYFLPGNPMAAMTAFELIALPSLLKMSGRMRCFPDAGLKKLNGEFFDDINEGRRFIRGRKDNGYVSALPNYFPNSVAGSVGCNCLIDLDENVRALFAGDSVWVITHFNDAEAVEEPIERNDTKIPILCICGIRNAGKTTFMEKLIRELASDDIRVAAIKHDGQDFIPDVTGTDSAKFRKAGAEFISVFSSNRSLVYGEQEIADEETYVRELISQISNVDLVLVEGLKASHFDKLEVLRKGVSFEEEIDGITMLRSVSVNGKLLATVSDAPVYLVEDEETKKVGDEVIRFEADDVVQVAEWLKDFYQLKMQNEDFEEWG